MERDYHNEDLDYFLRQKADQYKLYPSDRVWKGIHRYLHPKKRWYTIGGGLLLLTGLFFVSQYFITRPSANASAEVSYLSVSRPGTIQSTIEPSVPALNGNAVNEPATNVRSNNTIKNNLTRTPTSANLPTAATRSVAGKKNIIISPASSTLTADDEITGTEKKEAVTTLAPSTVKAQVATDHGTIHVALPPHIEVSSGITDLEDQAEAVLPEIEKVEELKPIGPNYINWLEELAAIKLTPRKKSPFNLQFYFSPTITYRRLADNQNGFHLNQQSIPMNNNAPNVDRYVDHKPSFGAELGSNVQFNVSRTFVLKTGVQLNYSRYNIKAYKFYFEKASIALNTAGPIADTIRAFTSIRNFNGYSPEELQNQYLQVSLPVGAELKLLGNRRLQFNIAGTIQPTYLLFNDTYLLSTDYVNYAKEASLVRKWNVNTSLEAFVSYNTGGLRWQEGPQFRYQLMSSYIDRYPIKEYLMEYGVKIGVSKTLR